MASIAVAAVAASGCAPEKTSGTVVTNFDPTSTAARFRDSGAPETTLASFCKHPPKPATPEGKEAIKISCSGRVLKHVGTARLFDKGNGLYVVIFSEPVRNGDICDPGTPPRSLCGNFSAGDKMRTSRIDAG